MDKILRAVLKLPGIHSKLEAGLTRSKVNSILIDANVSKFEEDPFEFKSCVDDAIESLNDDELSTIVEEKMNTLLAVEFPDLFGELDPNSMEVDGERSSGRTKRGTASRNVYVEPDEDDIPGGVYMSDQEVEAKSKGKKGGAKGRPKKLAVIETSTSITQAVNETTLMTSAVTKALKNVVKSLKSNESCEVFLKPVPKKEYPEYYEAVDRPMDLSTFSKNINGNEYENLYDALNDLALIWSNAIEYNVEGSPIYDVAIACQVISENLVTELLDEFLSTNNKKNKKDNLEKGDANGDPDVEDTSVPTDISRPIYVPLGKDSHGNPTGKLQLSKKLWKKYIKEIKDHPSAAGFLHPVAWHELEGYTDIVERPMDLETVCKQEKQKKQMD